MSSENSKLSSSAVDATQAIAASRAEEANRVKAAELAVE